MPLEDLDDDWVRDYRLTKVFFCDFGSITGPVLARSCTKQRMDGLPRPHARLRHEPVRGERRPRCVRLRSCAVIVFLAMVHDFVQALLV